MVEFEVTGISYQIGRGLPHPEASAAAKRFIQEHMKPGTSLLLVAEPNNPFDKDAIGVYYDYTRQIGRVKATCCPEVKPLLDEEGQCEAMVTGNDGNITLFVEIPHAPQTVPTAVKARVLPENPLEEVLRMNYTDEERSLQAVAPRLSKMVPTEENAAEMLSMIEHYMPLSHLSICYEDNFYRDHILRNLRKATRLKLEPELKSSLEQLRDLLSDIEGDQTRSSDHPKYKLMEAQLEKLSEIAEGEGRLIANFELHIVTSGSTLEAELDKLKDWFRTMPRLKLRDYQNHEKLAEELCYMRVSRKELYEVYAAIFILKRYAHVKVGNQDYKAIKDYVKKVESLLSSDWTEKAYEDLWDRVLTLPSVEAEILKVGKQKGTTFNRKLVANILHLMMQNGVFAVTATNQAMAEALEGTKDHSVRAEVGLALDDPSMKSAITRLIENK